MGVLVRVLPSQGAFNFIAKQSVDELLADQFLSCGLVAGLNPVSPAENSDPDDCADFADFARTLAIQDADGLTGRFRDLRFWRSYPPRWRPQKHRTTLLPPSADVDHDLVHPPCRLSGQPGTSALQSDGCSPRTLGRLTPASVCPAEGERMYRALLKKTVRFLKKDDGPTAVEYAVMLALIIVVCIAAITSLGSNSNSTFGNVSLTTAGS
jgi:pilus assembly protein Flp/PilA